MLRTLGAQVALLAFAAAVGVGLSVGNSPTTVLLRALLIMTGTLLVSQLVVAGQKRILRDHLQGKKLSIDREHLEAGAAAENRAAAGPGETG